MPVGVEIRTSLRTGPTNPTGPESGAWFIGGITETGPVTGKIPPVHNITEYERVWGPRTAASGLLYDQAMTFFAEGGGVLFVGRAVGVAATSAEVTLNSTGTVPALELAAKDPGAYAAAHLGVSVVGDYALRLTWDGQLRESHVKTSLAELVASLASSTLVTATNLGAPDAPLVAGSFSFTGGDADTDTVTSTQVLAGLTRLGEEYGPGAMSVPGYDATVAAGLVDHAAETQRIIIAAGPEAASIAEYQALAEGSSALAEYGGLFAPWVVIPDGSATRTISPEGYVAGVRARAFALEDEFWQVPAGQRAQARFVRGTETPYSLDDINTLADDHQVSGIITRRGAVYLYQYRSLSTDVTQWELLQSRDTVNALTARLSTALEPFVWEVIDGKGQLESNVLAAMIGVLQPVSDQGGLYSEFDANGEIIHPGYVVAATSTPDQLGHNTIAATAAVKLSPFAGLIEIELVKASFTAPLV